MGTHRAHRRAATGLSVIVAWVGPTLSLWAAVPQNAFQGDYWNLPTTSGAAPSLPSTSPTVSRTDAAINFAWGTASPTAGINADDFAVRWQGHWDFRAAGRYAFTITTNDGMRLFLDGVFLINAWKDQGTTTYTALATVTAGFHLVTVEFYDNGGMATAQASWQAIPPDSTPPTPPGQPTECGANWDCDYENGGYDVYWPAAGDPDTGIDRYELQQRLGLTGTWTTVSATVTGPRLWIAGGTHNTRYAYRVRAQNQAGSWGAWSAESDGVLVDTTAPSALTVTDDGATTTSTTQLHAVWTTASDAESGVSAYEYQIRQGSTTGTLLVNWTSTGTTLSVTRTGLRLTSGNTYYVAARAKNGAGTYSATSYSDGITLTPDTTPPTGSVTINGGSARVNTPAVTLTLSATDPGGVVTQMQFANDGLTYSIPQAYTSSASWTLTSGDGPKTVHAQYHDAAGNRSPAVRATIVLDTVAPQVAVTSPPDGATLFVP